jgi:purine catabolism regulator
MSENDAFYMSENDTFLLTVHKLSLMNLVNAGSIGLGIKKDRFLKNMPEELIIIAEKYQFPIVEIPYRFSWSDIIAVFYDLKYNVTEQSCFTIEPDHIETIYNAGRCGSRQLLEKLTEYFQIPLAILFNSKKTKWITGYPVLS